MSRPTSGVRRFWRMEEGGTLACLYGETDLDQVALEAAVWCAKDDGYYAWAHDQPTWIGDNGYETRIGWFRTAPCICGDEHSFDLMDAEPHARGAFLGVNW